ncbi:ribose 5-phosphate isomerase B [Rubellicoccus peritrichatus]|uniref:Ribose 5-phosphate isomerase B n=1 Tax=Rubellicoccus peritrichatus TaxID=3080537 RepID=A0AAQ3LE84_9BACT|nr:ribose 5-phosphate isomerase B [Puniceicoccus sp. CR14]WOO43042.1 ribose 5-phosphate isomerase B [Puniceicoccus sp. CR14]
MKISIGADHGGFGLKEAVKQSLLAEGHEVIDHGTNSTESVDYPDYGEAVAWDVVNGVADRGVAICTTGIGISMAVNKVRGARGAVCHNEDAAEFCRRHNKANVICFGQKYDTPYMAAKMTKIFLETEFEGGGRHDRRINKIAKIEGTSD